MRDGVIVLNKHRGISSHQAVQRVKRITHAKKAGHTGTLDPFATGVLPVLLNKATSVAQYLQNARKVYQGSVLLGTATNTLDFTGEVTETAAVPPLDRAEVARVLKSLEGEQEQIPPMFSAVKIGGQPLYKMARQGMVVERKSKHVNIYSIDLETVEDGTIGFVVACSSGTYVRVLAADIAKRLGTVGHLINLVRLANGALKLEDAVSLDELKVISQEGRLEEYVKSPNEALSGFAALRVRPEAVRRMRNGQGFDTKDLIGEEPGESLEGGEILRVIDTDGALVAMASPLHGQIQGGPIRFRVLRFLGGH